jgi:hypothetical protein
VKIGAALCLVAMSLAGCAAAPHLPAPGHPLPGAGNPRSLNLTPASGVVGMNVTGVCTPNGAGMNCYGVAESPEWGEFTVAGTGRATLEVAWEATSIQTSTLSIDVSRDQTAVASASGTSPQRLEFPVATGDYRIGIYVARDTAGPIKQEANWAIAPASALT